MFSEGVDVSIFLDIISQEFGSSQPLTFLPWTISWVAGGVYFTDNETSFERFSQPPKSDEEIRNTLKALHSARFLIDEATPWDV